MTKKAAMFGLDARIALAIFGALSVITGVALYNTIKHMRVIAFANEITEIAKAYEQYYVDTGSHLPSLDPTTLDVYELTSSSKVGWKGPYFDFFYSDGEGVHYAYHKNPIDGKHLMLIIRKIKDTGGSCSTPAPDCYVRLSFYNSVSTNNAKKLKLYFDNTDDLSHIGKLSTSPVSGVPGMYSVNLKVMPYN